LYSEFGWKQAVTHQHPSSSSTPTIASKNAGLKAISRRTSYFRVRLAFYLYPQFIQAFFNRHWFGPPGSFTFPSPWPWIAHSVSGQPLPTKGPIKTPSQLNNIRFPYASATEWLRLAGNELLAGLCSKRHEVVPIRKRIKTPSACRRTVSGTISLPSTGYFSPFPCGTCSLSVAIYI